MPVVADMLRRHRARLRVQSLHGKFRKKRRRSLSIAGLPSPQSLLLYFIFISSGRSAWRFSPAALLISAIDCAPCTGNCAGGAKGLLLAGRFPALTAGRPSQRASALYGAAYLYDARLTPFLSMALHHSRLFVWPGRARILPTALIPSPSNGHQMLIQVIYYMAS